MRPAPLRLRRWLFPALLPWGVLVCLAAVSQRWRVAVQEDATPCRESTAVQLQVSRDLYCIELTAVPALARVSASFELNRFPSPFGANVTRDGALVYAPVLRAQGLPEPGAFAEGARVWVAWLTTPLLQPTRKLGTVGNGENALPRIDWSKFLILVTAELSPAVTEPSGRVALRGFSPSSRLQPPDMIEFLYGALPAAQKAARESAQIAHAAHAGDTTRAPASGAASWLHPPMPRGLAMMPAEMNLAAPGATPFLPQVAASVAVPDAKPREVVRVQDGDTLVLTAGLVRQTIGRHSFIGYGYNGQVPGPIIWAAQDATIVVRYRNHIEWPTTVHWHGIRLANRYDGASGVTQPPVPPQGEFDYLVHLRDAGLYWYHPHRREDILKDLGLYGNVMVRAPRAEYGPAHREEVLMLDDIEVAAEGVMPYGAERASHALMGRFGNVLLVNGRRDWSLPVALGEVVRFFLTNVTNARTFNVSFGDARIKVLGSDVGNFEREEWVESVVIAPAERYIVDVRFARAGAVAFENRVMALDHTFGRFFPQVDTLGTVQVGEAPVRPDHSAAFHSLRRHSRVRADIDRYRTHFNRPPDRQLVIRMEAEDLPFVVDRFLRFDSVYFQPVEWSGTMPMMNWNTTTNDVRWILEEPGTGRRNMDIRWDFRVGDVVKIRIANLRHTLHGMQHPIHFHGQRFLVLDQNGVRNTNLAWKDTFLLPAGGTADLLLEISNPGEWMAHCHVAEHMESGMMMTFVAR
jgi:FtsP/CotA-like multicopper oxidase with cupredoxin domain